MDVDGQQAESAGGESATTCCALGSAGDGEGEGGGRAPAVEHGGEYSRQREEEQLVYPWVGLLAKAGDCGPSEAELRATFSEFHPKRVVIFEAREEGSPAAALLFDKNLEGYQDGFAFERCFLEKGREKKAWHRDKEEGGCGVHVGSHFYGWLAGQEDFYKEDEVGNFLFQHGELKTVAMVVEEQFAKHERRLEFLSATTAKKQEMLAQELAASMSKQKEVVQALQSDLDKKNEEIRSLRVDSARQVLQATQSLEADLQRKDVELRGLRAETARQVLQATQSLEADLEKKNEELEDFKAESARQLGQAMQRAADLEKKVEVLEGLKVDSGKKPLHATHSLETRLEKKQEELVALEEDYAAVQAALQQKEDLLSTVEADSATLREELKRKDAELADMEAICRSLQAKVRDREEQLAAAAAAHDKELEGVKRELAHLRLATNDADGATQVAVPVVDEESAEELRPSDGLQQWLDERSGSPAAPRPDEPGEAGDGLGDRAELVWAVDALKRELDLVRDEKRGIHTQLEEARKRCEEQELQMQKLAAEVEEKSEEAQNIARASVKQSLEFVLIQSRHDRQLKDFGRRLAGKCRELETAMGELSRQRDQAGQGQNDMFSEAESSSELYVELMVWARELTDRGNTIANLSRKLEEKRRQNSDLKAELDRRKFASLNKHSKQGSDAKGWPHIAPLPSSKLGGSKLQKVRPKNGVLPRTTKTEVMSPKYGKLWCAAGKRLASKLRDRWCDIPGLLQREQLWTHTHTHSSPPHSFHSFPAR